MKLDSEAQREELLDLLSTVPWTVTIETIERAQAKMEEVLDPIRNAEIEDE